MSTPDQELKAYLSQEEILARVMPLAEKADAALDQELKTQVETIDRVGRYIIFSGGKRLRPALFMLAVEAAGGRPDPRLAAIFEYLHAATLLHDDVVDEAGLRRGLPAARVEYGNEAVVLVGDYLFSKCYSLAVEVPDLRFVMALTECTTTMAEGQVLELIHTGNLSLGRGDYLGVIRAKTAVLLAAACQMGGIFSGIPDAQVDAFFRYGLELGLAFQMVDDALDYVGTQHEFGKPVGHDLAEGKITLPFIHARDHAPVQVRERLLDLARRGVHDPSLLGKAKEIVKEQGGVDACMKAAMAHAANAQKALEPLLSLSGLAPGIETMLSLAWYVIARRH